MANDIQSKKISKISIRTFDKVLKENGANTEVIEWHGHEVTITKTLSLKDVLTFVDTVVQSCFDFDTAEYRPEIKIFIMKSCILEMYAGFTLPSNIEHRYELVYGTDAVETVLKHINMEQLNEITDAVSEKIEHRAQANIEAVHRQMNDVCNAFSDMQEKFGSILSNINEGDISKIVSSFAENGGVDEEKLVKAYMENKPSDMNEETAEIKDGE